MSHSEFPALCIGLIVGAYWTRVLRLALKTRRRTGRAGNLLPPEPLGRTLRIVWYPTVVLWVILPIVVALTDPAKAAMPLRRLYVEPAIAWPGVAIAAAALVATWICWRRMGKSWRMGIDPAEKTRLIVTGPFAYVRHPIYALSSMLMLATLVAVPAPAMLAVATVHLLLLQWEARREERHLIDVHGPRYEAYARHVGRFFPRSLSPYASDAAHNNVPNTMKA